MIQTARQHRFTGPPRMTLVMPVRNEERYLDQTLQSIANQTVSQKEYELLIFDANSTDTTLEIAKAWVGRIENLHIGSNTRVLPAAARNLGLKKARGEFVAFVEGHCILPEDYVEKAIELFDSRSADALGRPINLVVPTDPSIQQSIGIARMSSLGHATSSLLYSDKEGFCSSVSCATIYRRNVFDQLGVFDERLDVAEDVEFNKRFDAAGLKHYFSQDLACLYHPRRTLKEFIQQMYRYGLGRIRSSRKQGRVSVIDFVPLPFLCTLFVTITVGFWIPILWLYPSAYFLLLASYAIQLALANQRPILAGQVFVALLMIHLGMAFGQLGGFTEWILKR